MKRKLTVQKINDMTFQAELNVALNLDGHPGVRLPEAANCRRVGMSVTEAFDYINQAHDTRFGC